MKLPLLSLSAKPSTVTVQTELFGTPVNLDLISQAVHIYRSNQRQGGAKTLTRGEVSRTTAKWYKQKGTGRARHGARSAPIFVGGGVTHGPTGLENWKRAFPVRMARKALISSLSAAAESSCVSVVADLEKLSGKASEAVKFVEAARTTANERLLIVIDQSHTTVLRSLRNLERVSVTRADRLTTFEVVSADKVVIMEPALAVLSHRLVEKQA